ncbi:MAG: hypothetical protein AABX94_01940 [Nanoarchaeota archaeon]
MCFVYKENSSLFVGGDEMANIQSLQDPHIIALVERLGAIDAFYGITPEERSVLNVIRGVSGFETED